jgi:hypothetical protein
MTSSLFFEGRNGTGSESAKEEDDDDRGEKRIYEGSSSDCREELAAEWKGPTWGVEGGRRHRSGRQW